MLLRPIFCEKLKIDPHKKAAPLKRLNFRIWPKNRTQFRRRPFLFFFFFFFFLKTTCFWAEKTFEFRIWAEKSDSISAKTFSFFFFFYLETTCFWAEKTFEFRIWAEKSDTISAKTFFFFLETTCFWAEKTFEFPRFPRNFGFSDKPCETDSRTIKIRVKVVCTFLTFSK